ncbi:MAG: hypothetical protein AMXMBFR64_04770 [Myxococcales bacterium]
MSEYTAADRERWRRAALAKGQEVADKLARLLGSEDVELADLDLLYGGEPRERPKERLRRFLDHLMKTARGVDGESFGRCDGCGEDLSVTELDALPWATTCVRCAPAAE